MNRLRASVSRLALDAAMDQPVEVAPVLLGKALQRGEVVRHPAHDLLLRQPLGQGDLDRPVEGEDAAVHLVQDGQGVLHRQGAADHRAAESLSRDLDLFRQGDFLFPRKQGDFRHLREVEADRVAAPLRRLRRGRGGLARRFARGKPRRGGLVRVGLLANVVELLCGRLVDQVDPLFLQGDQQVVELVGIDFFVGQVIVDFIVGQVALRFPPSNQLLQILVE